MGDLRELIDQRATLSTGEPLTKGEHFAHVLLPSFLEDMLKSTAGGGLVSAMDTPEEKTPTEKARNLKC